MIHPKLPNVEAWRIVYNQSAIVIKSRGLKSQPAAIELFDVNTGALIDSVMTYSLYTGQPAWARGFGGVSKQCSCPPGHSACEASNLATDHQAVGNGQQDTFDTRVCAEPLIQGIDGPRGFVFRIHHPTALEHVVEHDHTIRSKSSKNEVIVELIGRFIGIDEGEVEHGSAGIVSSSGRPPPKRNSIRLSTPARFQ